MKLFKIKPEWCDSEEERSLVYVETFRHGTVVKGKAYGNPFGFSIEPIERFRIDQIEYIQE